MANAADRESLPFGLGTLFCHARASVLQPASGYGELGYQLLHNAQLPFEARVFCHTIGDAYIKRGFVPPIPPPLFRLDLGLSLLVFLCSRYLEQFLWDLDRSRVKVVLL